MNGPKPINNYIRIIQLASEYLQFYNALLYNTVPVVYGGSNSYAKLAPNQTSYINARNFTSGMKKKEYENN